MAKQYSVTRMIDAPRERVWGLLTDATSYCSWNPAVLSIVGPILMGNKIELVSVVDPKRTFKLQVSVMEPPGRMVWRDGLALGLFTGARTYLLADRGGHTEFSMTELFSGPLSGLIVKAIPDMTASFNQFADGLKAAAECAPPLDDPRVTDSQ